MNRRLFIELRNPKMSGDLKRAIRKHLKDTAPVDPLTVEGRYEIDDRRHIKSDIKAYYDR